VNGREVYIKMQSDRVFSRVNTNKTTTEWNVAYVFPGQSVLPVDCNFAEDEIDNAETNNYFNSFVAK
jgi:hypothetical protein